jgi:hypothetical protein
VPTKVRCRLVAPAIRSWHCPPVAQHWSSSRLKHLDATSCYLAEASWRHLNLLHSWLSLSLTHTHIQTHTHRHTCIYMWLIGWSFLTEPNPTPPLTRIYIYVYIHISSIYIYRYLIIHIFHICLYITHIYIKLHTYIHTYICMYVCIYIRCHCTTRMWSVLCSWLRMALRGVLYACTCS